MFFQSDNCSGVHPQVLASFAELDPKYQAPYGNDLYSSLLQKELSRIFEKEVLVFLASTGTAANGLALSGLVKPYETILCSKMAHIEVNENTGASFFCDGANLTLVESIDGKINPADLESTIMSLNSIRPHGKKPGCISITQSTEVGTIYDLGELREIKEIALKHQLPIHVDGARFVNSLVATKSSPADLTWKNGVDVLSLGATKNGALCAEAVIFFNKKFSEYFDYRYKRSGQQLSKTSFFANQFLAYFKNDLWLKNAQIANNYASKLKKIFDSKNIEVVYPSQTNQLFVKIPENVATFLQQQGCKFYRWEKDIYRFVTSWATTEADLSAFEKLISNLPLI